MNLGSLVGKKLESRENVLLIWLFGIFLTNALLAEIIGVKIFSGEKLLGLEPAQIPLFDSQKLDFNLTAGVLIWPVVFVTTDIINEYFGQKGVKRISYITVVFILYSFLVLTLATGVPPADFWLEVNGTDASGNAFDIDYAFNTVFRQGMGIIVGSLVAFLIGQLLDAYVFHRIRRITGDRMLWLRATGSTLVSQLIDSFVVLFVAFYIFGEWTWELVISVGIINYLYKFAVAILITPLLYVAHAAIDRYLVRNQV